MDVKVDTSTLHILIHHHRFGEDAWLFTANGAPTDGEGIARALGVDFEPEREEWIDIVRAVQPKSGIPEIDVNNLSPAEV